MEEKTKYISAAIIIIAVIVLVSLIVVKTVVNPVVRNIDVTFTNDEAYFRAQSEGRSKEDFVRASGLTGLRYKKISDNTDAAKTHIAGMGFYRLENIRVIDRKSIVLEISARTAHAVISDAGKYCIVDEEGYLLSVGSSKPDNLIIIGGISLNNMKAGQKAVDDRGLVASALEIVSIIKANRYESIYTGVAMRENKEVFLQTASSVPVIINLRYDVKQSLDIAKGIFDSGVTDGHIEIAGDYGYYIPDTGTDRVRGM